MTLISEGVDFISTTREFRQFAISLFCQSCRPIDPDSMCPFALGARDTPTHACYGRQ